MTIAPKGGYQVVLELKTENNNRETKEERFGSYCTNTDLNKWHDTAGTIKTEISYKLLQWPKPFLLPPFVNLVSKDSGGQTPIEQQMVFF